MKGVVQINHQEQVRGDQSINLPGTSTIIYG